MDKTVWRFGVCKLASLYPHRHLAFDYDLVHELRSANVDITISSKCHSFSFQFFPLRWFSTHPFVRSSRSEDEADGQHRSPVLWPVTQDVVGFQLSCQICWRCEMCPKRQTTQMWNPWSAKGGKERLASDWQLVDPRCLNQSLFTQIFLQLARGFWFSNRVLHLPYCWKLLPASVA